MQKDRTAQCLISIREIRGGRIEDHPFVLQSIDVRNKPDIRALERAIDVEIESADAYDLHARLA